MSYERNRQTTMNYEAAIPLQGADVVINLEGEIQITRKPHIEI